MAISVSEARSRSAELLPCPSWAWRQLTGTLVTIAGFVPIGFAESGAGKYCFTMFAVIGIALMASWLVAILFTPLRGVVVLRDIARSRSHGRRAPLTLLFAGTLQFGLRHCHVTIAAILGLFVLFVDSMSHVRQEFFPPFAGPELLVGVTLAQDASIHATGNEVDRLEKLFAADPDIESWSFCVGQGVVRCYLPLDAQLAKDFFAQAAVVTKGYEERAAVQGSFANRHVRFLVVAPEDKFGSLAQLQAAGQDTVCADVSATGALASTRIVTTVELQLADEPWQADTWADLISIKAPQR